MRPSVLPRRSARQRQLLHGLPVRSMVGRRYGNGVFFLFVNFRRQRYLYRLLDNGRLLRYLLRPQVRVQKRRVRFAKVLLQHLRRFFGCLPPVFRHRRQRRRVLDVFL